MQNHTNNEQKNSHKLSGDLDKDFSELLKEKEKEADIDNSLAEIYKTEDGIMVPAGQKRERWPAGNNINMHIERREIALRKKITQLLLILLIFLAGLSWGTFWLFNQGSRLNTKDIELSISGPTLAIAGEEVTYEVKYQNLSPFNLKNVEFYVSYPDSFIFSDAVPSPAEERKIWRIAQVNSKHSGLIKFKGRLVDLPETAAEFSASITYRPENFSSTFSADALTTTSISTVGINVNVEAPYFFNVNDEKEIVVQYARQKENFIDNFVILFEHSNNFILNKDMNASPWVIANITDAQQKFIIKGKYEAQSADDGQALKIMLAVPEQKDITVDDKTGPIVQTINHIFYQYEWSPAVANGALNLDLTANGSSAGKPVNFGDNLNYVVHYKNASGAALKNVIIMATIISDNIDWQALQDKQQGEIRGDSVIWSKEQLKELAEIQPNGEGSFSFSLKLKTANQAPNAAAGGQVQTSLDYSIDSVPQPSSNPVVKIINQIAAP